LQEGRRGGPIKVSLPCQQIRRRQQVASGKWQNVGKAGIVRVRVRVRATRSMLNDGGTRLVASIRGYDTPTTENQRFSRR